MTKSQSVETAGQDFFQQIFCGKEFSEEESKDVLTNNLRTVMESTSAAMRILDFDFNVVLENQMMKEMGGVDAEESEFVKCYDQFCNPDVCGTDNRTLNQIVDEMNALDVQSDL